MKIFRPYHAIARAAAFCAALAAVALAYPGDTVGGRTADLDSTCTGTHRPWLLDDAPVTAGSAAQELPLRVVTYNIHSGLGETHALRRARTEVEQNLRTIAADIAAAAPIDIVALNEVDFDSHRSAGIDQSDFLAGELHRLTGERYQVVRGRTWQRDWPGLRVRFGNALLSRLPVLRSGSCLLRDGQTCDMAAEVAQLPSLHVGGLRGLFTEQRGLIKATLRAGGREVDVLVTHLDPFQSRVRETQALHVLRRFVDPSRSTVLLGDLNAVSTSITGRRRFFASDRTLDILTSDTLADVRMTLASEHALDSLDRWATFPARVPVWPLDAVLASVDLRPSDVRVIGRTASDHRGMFAELVFAADQTTLAGQQARHDRIRRRQLQRMLHCDVATEKSRLARGWLVAETGFASLLGAAAAAPVR